MASLYPSVAAHPLLTAKALGRGPTVLAAEQELAEGLLGLVAPATTDAFELSRVSTALAVQINFQVEQGVSALVASYQSSAHSRQQMAYRDRVINPQAAQIIATLPGLTGRAFDAMISHRKI